MAVFQFQHLLDRWKPRIRYLAGGRLPLSHSRADLYIPGILLAGARKQSVIRLAVWIRCYGILRSGLGAGGMVSAAKYFLGIDLPGEKSGVVPDKEWKLKNKNEQWFIGDTYNMSIGQGNLLVTPLWLNAYTAAIANGGRILKPYLVSHIAKGDSLRTTTEPVVIGVADFSAKNLKIVQDAMRATVTEGTAKLLADLPYPVAAKTGTAQVAKGQTNSLISVWGPFTDPDIAMTVVIEGTKESYGLVHRVAHDFLSWYFTTHPQKQ